MGAADAPLSSEESQNSVHSAKNDGEGISRDEALEESKDQANEKSTPDTNMRSPSFESQQAESAASVQDAFSSFAAEVKAAAGNNGNGSQADAKDVQTDTDVAMTDAPEADPSEAIEALATRVTRKRGAPARSKANASISSRPSKAPKKSQLTSNLENTTTSGDASEQTGSDKGDGTGREGSAHDAAAAEGTPAITEPEPRRSGRRAIRKTKTYAEEDSDAEFNPAPSLQSKEDMAPAKSQSMRGGGSRVWTADHLLQDPKSKLVKADILTILRDPRAWTSLNPEQQSKVISLLPNAPALAPDPADPTASLPDIPQQMLTSNSAFRADISMFQDDLSEGRLDPDWQRDGLVAMERRARGDFDAWKEKEVESFWGQKQKLSYDVLAGESSKVKLETLVAAGCWEVGDVWLYTRTFGKGKHAVVVEKEATIASITEDNRIIFRFPDGQRKFSSATAGEDVETEALDSLAQLADKIIETDGRIGTWRHANVWKDIRSFRKNQDIGSLWEIREIHWARQQENSR